MIPCQKTKKSRLMFRYMPITLAIIIAAIISFGQFLPLGIIQLLFGLAITIKSLIIFLLPIVIFSLLYKAALNLAKDASQIILLIITSVIFSNALTTFLSQFLGSWIYQLDMSLTIPKAAIELEPSILFELPALIPNHIAMFSGIICGIFSAKIIPTQAPQIGASLEKVVNYLLQIIGALIPIFVAGFIAKLQYDGTIAQIITDYSMIFMVIAISQISYITILYLVFNKFSLSGTLTSIKNMLPAAFSGFSTMSSAASMPLTLVGTENNAKNKDLVHTVVPATVNIHLIGDCIAIPCFAFAILKNYGMELPTFFIYMTFTAYFVLAKFSVAAIPGGGIIVMLPILEQYLGFNSEMLSLITALYILFDPVATATNILGNGAIAQFIDKIYDKFTIKRKMT